MCMLHFVPWTGWGCQAAWIQTWGWNPGEVLWQWPDFRTGSAFSPTSPLSVSLRLQVLTTVIHSSRWILLAKALLLPAVKKQKILKTHVLMWFNGDLAWRLRRHGLWHSMNLPIRIPFLWFTSEVDSMWFQDICSCFIGNSCKDSFDTVNYFKANLTQQILWIKQTC